MRACATLNTLLSDSKFERCLQQFVDGVPLDELSYIVMPLGWNGSTSNAYSASSWSEIGFNATCHGEYGFLTSNPLLQLPRNVSVNVTYNISHGKSNFYGDVKPSDIIVNRNVAYDDFMDGKFKARNHAYNYDLIQYEEIVLKLSDVENLDDRYLIAIHGSKRYSPDEIITDDEISLLNSLWVDWNNIDFGGLFSPKMVAALKKGILNGKIEIIKV